MGALVVLAGATLSVAASDERRTVASHRSGIADFSDPRAAVAWADDVFVGTVVQDLGPQPADPIPQSLFVALVSETLKGRLTGAVFVDQAGGIDAYGSQVRPGGDPPLEVGADYLFVTKTHRNGWWHTPIPRHGDVRLGPRTIVEAFRAAAS